MRFKVDGKLIHIHISQYGSALKNRELWRLLGLLNDEGSDKFLRIQQMGIVLPPSDQQAVSMSAFVIPGTARYSCIRCGSCCRNVLGGCPAKKFLEPNVCIDYENRLSGCRAFPFRLFNAQPFSNLLMVATVCKGYGQGEFVSTYEYKKIVDELAAPDRNVSGQPPLPFDIGFDAFQNKWYFKSER